jgi:hypothetical protein
MRDCSQRFFKWHGGKVAFLWIFRLSEFKILVNKVLWLKLGLLILRSAIADICGLTNWGGGGRRFRACPKVMDGIYMSWFSGFYQSIIPGLLSCGAICQVKKIC